MPLSSVNISVFHFITDHVRHSTLQKKNAGQLKSAAQSALQGDTAALTQVLNELAADPQAKQAMEQLDQTLNK